MKTKDIIAGLDIGTTKIACFVGQRGEDGVVEIIGFGKSESIGVERGTVLNIKNAAASITTAVNAASEMANYDIKSVYVGIAGQHIKSQKSPGSIMIPTDHDFIQQSDVDLLIENQHHIMLGPGEEIIHVIPQSYVVDGEELSNEVNPVGVAGNQLNAVFHLVTGNTANIKTIHQAVKMAGLRVEGVVLQPIASAYAVLDDTDKEAGVALVDIGGGTTDIAIFHEGIIRHTAVLPLAGNVITNDIKNKCMIMKDKAESLKTRFGSCLPEEVSDDDVVAIPGIRNQNPREISLKTLANIIKLRTDLILDQVCYEIQVSGYEKQLIGGIVITGGGAMLHHIKELAAFKSSTDTRIGLPTDHISKNTLEEHKHPMYATGIGLVLYGIEQHELELQRKMENSDYTDDQTGKEDTTTTDQEGTTNPPENEEGVLDDLNGRSDDSNPQKKRKDGWLTKVKVYLENIFNDDVDNIKDEN